MRTRFADRCAEFRGFDEETWASLVDTIWDAGGRPRIPETREAIKDLRNVEKWMKEKAMLALTFRSDSGAIEIDLLVQQSHRFDQLKARAKKIEFGGTEFLVVSLNDLIENEACRWAASGPS
ncbi:MAG TPA: hypothetical protein PKD61_06740 [Polyangiaceae bacterium]|nr:hypothetical protein [Polyangiaceae bacterium]